MKLRASAPVRLLKAVAMRCRIALDKLPKHLFISGGDVSCEGVRLHFPKEVGISYATNLFWSGEKGYEPTTTRVLLALMPGARHFMDIGSNIGFYSVLARKLFPSMRVDAFEPIPSIHQKNLQFHEANGLSNEGIWPKACSNRDGTTTIFFPLFEGAVEEDQTATLRSDSWQHQREMRQEIEIETVKIDSFLSERPAGGPLLLKIDVEDHEAAVLEGASETLRSRRPMIICEMLPREHGNRETWNFLDTLGYIGFAITADGLFRFGLRDSLLDRELKDFLCLPLELGKQCATYLPFSALTELREAWCSAENPVAPAISDLSAG